jgi:hypothetical protein
VFSGIIEAAPRPDRREIAEARFFELDALPVDVGRRVAMGLELLRASSPSMGVISHPTATSPPSKLR